MIRQDRRELSFLGALLLAWGLVAAPIVHSVVEHAEQAELGAHGHSHGPSAPGTEHGQGSLEHGKALFGSAPPAPALVLVVVALALTVEATPQSPSLSAWPRVEKSQGP